MRILVLGLDNSGKTTILRALSNESVEEITPTKGFNIKNLVHEGFKLNVWDVGGQKGKFYLRKNFFIINQISNPEIINNSNIKLSFLKFLRKNDNLIIKRYNFLIYFS